MWPGYLVVGGLEVGNSARTLGYTQTSDCPTFWLKDTTECGTLQEALGHDPYTYDNIQQAPWFDIDLLDQSSRFLGVYIISMEGVQDSTREAAVTQRLQDGGRIGRIRRATREIRIRAMLTAKGEDAMEYGMSWLDAVLSPGACGSHGDACGVTDMEFFSACPPPRPDVLTDTLFPGEDLLPAEDLYPEVATLVPATPEEYAALVDTYRRFFHDVACTSGPFTVEEFLSSDDVHVGRVVEFTITCQNPWMYGVTTPVQVPSLVPSVVQDIAYNLNTRPSAELSLGSFTVATNYSTNPSVAVNATGWSAVAGGAITAPTLSSGRVTGELFADVGDNASFRTVFTAAGASAIQGEIINQQEVALGAGTGARYSFTIWSASVIMAGAPTLLDIEFLAFWLNGSGGPVLSMDLIGTVDPDGGAVSVKSLLPPPGATHVLVRAMQPLTSWNAGTIVRLYTDALAVTNP
jgi:hypothetical protein